MGTVFTEVATFATEACCVCGVKFAIPQEMQNRLRLTHDFFYCPNGHSQHYTGETEAERLKKQLAQEQHRREQIETARTDLMKQRDGLERRLRSQRGTSTRIRNRIKHGVCPCCNRTFEQLARHMATQHPDFKPVDAE